MTEPFLRRAGRHLLLPGLVALLGLSACNSEEAGTTVTFEVLHHMPADSLGSIPDHHELASRVFTTDLDYRVTLTRGYFVLSALEIRPSAVGGSAPPLLGWLDRLLPAAEAHSTGSPTRLGAPNVIDLLAADLTPRVLGHIEPPPGAYGRLRVSWGPADDDAGFLPADVDMVEQTLRLTGRAVKGADTLDFAVTDAGTDSVEVFFIADSEHGAPGWLGVSNDRLSLAAGESATVGVGMVYSTWFDGVEFRTMSSEAVHDRVMANIRASLGYHPVTGGGHNHLQTGTRWPTGG